VTVLLPIISSPDKLFTESREFHLSPSLFLGEFQLSLPEERLEALLDFFGEFQLSFSDEELLGKVFSGELQLPLFADPALEFDFCGEFQLPLPDSEFLSLPGVEPRTGSGSSMMMSASRFLFSMIPSLRPDTDMDTSEPVSWIFRLMFSMQARAMADSSSSSIVPTSPRE